MKEAKQEPKTETILESINVGLLELKKMEFYVAESGFTGLRYDGSDYPHITLKRTLPVSQPMDYISVTDRENKEIGIIKSISDMKGEQLQIAVNELNNRYYCPDVLEIKSVKDKLGYVYMELLLRASDGKSHVKSCAIQDVNKNIRMLGNESLLIFDVDGNRYIVKSLSTLDKGSMRKLEPYLF